MAFLSADMLYIKPGYTTRRQEMPCTVHRRYLLDDIFTDDVVHVRCVGYDARGVTGSNRYSLVVVTPMIPPTIIRLLAAVTM